MAVCSTAVHSLSERVCGCSGQTSGRSDDNAAVIRKRFNTYLQSVRTQGAAYVL